MLIIPELRNLLNMHFDWLFEWILNWVKVTPTLGGLGLQQRCLILLMMIHVMQNITVKPICPYIGVVVCSIIIHNINAFMQILGQSNPVLR